MTADFRYFKELGMVDSSDRKDQVVSIIPVNLQNAALDSKINLGKVEAENAGITP